MLTFSIVIPNFNQSHFLPWAFESLRHQRVPFNVALMDGGSSDDFQSVAARYSHMIDHLESGPDGGQAAAIKKGKASVPGDIVAWLNADDYYFPGALDRVASVFEKNPRVDVVYGNAIHVTADGCFLSYFPPVQSFNPKDLRRSCFICQPACFVRRNAYECIGGVDASLKYTMDWDLWQRLSLAGATFQYLNEMLAAVRYYPGTKTMSGDRRRYGEIRRIEKKYGRRPIPFSWAGFYRYDLFFKKERNFHENAALFLLDRLRGAKKKIKSFQRSKSYMAQTLYGFHRWNPVVEKSCTIHLPWYDKRQWRNLSLAVKPCGEDYIIGVNDEICNYAISKTGCLVVDVPHITEPYRKISISRLEMGVWQLLDFHCDLLS